MDVHEKFSETCINNLLSTNVLWYIFLCYFILSWIVISNNFYYFLSEEYVLQFLITVTIKSASIRNKIRAITRSHIVDFNLKYFIFTCNTNLIKRPRVIQICSRLKCSTMLSTLKTNCIKSSKYQYLKYHSMSVESNTSANHIFPLKYVHHVVKIKEKTRTLHLSLAIALLECLG